MYIYVDAEGSLVGRDVKRGRAACTRGNISASLEVESVFAVRVAGQEVVGLLVLGGSSRGEGSVLADGPVVGLLCVEVKGATKGSISEQSFDCEGVERTHMGL